MSEKPPLRHIEFSWVRKDKLKHITVTPFLCRWGFHNFEHFEMMNKKGVTVGGDACTRCCKTTNAYKLVPKEKWPV